MSALSQRCHRHSGNGGLGFRLSSNFILSIHAIGVSLPCRRYTATDDNHIVNHKSLSDKSSLQFQPGFELSGLCPKSDKN